ncbi:LuxR family transcriptional regulator [Streptomyces sp. ICC1]|nr:LuxR family transcriptional regulator [Streptomyces sp. ICC4]AWZ12793.1 LuxR family transcriptional regulator [Streptomyces sp. ICC1]
MIMQYVIMKGESMCTKTDREIVSEGNVLCAGGVAAYRAAVNAGSLRAVDAPDCVVALGLLRGIPGVDGVLVPVAPAGPLAQALRPHEEGIRRHRNAIAATQAAFAAAEMAYREAQGGQGGQLALLLGDSVIDAALDRAVTSCREELLTVQPGGGRAEHLLAGALPRDLGALRRGVRQRTLYQHGIRSHLPTLEYARRITSAGGEVRTTSEDIDRVIICDRRVAFVPGDDPGRTPEDGIGGGGGGSGALMVRHPALVRHLVRCFERCWDNASVVGALAAPARTEVVTSDIQSRILRLLIEGHTDASMAVRLGVSARTVAEHVRRISQQLGSSSRAQLGYRIASSGLLDEHVQAD